MFLLIVSPNIPDLEIIETVSEIIVVSLVLWSVDLIIVCIIFHIVPPKLHDLEFMETVSENRGNFMTKIPVRVMKKSKKSCGEKVCTNIHSMNNQEFRFPSLIQRVKALWTNLF